MLRNQVKTVNCLHDINNIDKNNALEQAIDGRLTSIFISSKSKLIPLLKAIIAGHVALAFHCYYS
ncbi:hypothetical protein LCGC14_0700620 [marine sediment metagenome]|uniref:Uncharacterized protein n=1 Tax=marine sediment metagenome TaxID=412755 RepID=A0A0F9T3U6_9ZZZZ